MGHRRGHKHTNTRRSKVLAEEEDDKLRKGLQHHTQNPSELLSVHRRVFTRRVSIHISQVSGRYTTLLSELIQGLQHRDDGILDE